jgi:ParB family chromosome partitioning protein
MAKQQAVEAEQVTVDEAVLAAGGQPSSDFLEGLKKATGQADKEARAEVAAEHFDRRANAATRAVLPLRQLRSMAQNPRSKVGDVSALVASINANGFIGALSVRELEPNVFEVWAGNRRLQAAIDAGLEEVPCDIYELTEVQALELNLTEQINRSDLTPLEEGRACRALQELSGYSVDQVAQKLGQSSSWVTKRVALCGLAPEALSALAKGELQLSVAQALAALPSQRLQVEGMKALENERWLDTVDKKLEHLRTKLCQPLKGAPWKLTDDSFAAGACSACPHNSANATMPGLFDSGKATPMCALPSCFEDKVKAVWEKKTTKLKAQGAKVLGVAESKKLFRYSDNLGYGSRYVEASAPVQEDKQKRSWAQLAKELPEEARPVVHVAQDSAGKVRELYVKDKAVEAIATHLKLAWAVKHEEATEAKAEKSDSKKVAAERLAGDTRKKVQVEVINAVALRLAEQFSRPAIQQLAEWNAGYEEQGIEQYFAEVIRKKRPKDWFKEAPQAELLAFLWWDRANDSWSTYSGFDEEFLATAKRYGFNVEKMVAANLAAAEPIDDEKKPAKKGGKR